MSNLSIIIISHNKPDAVKEAVQSIIDQKHEDWEAFLIDSGVLLKQGFFDYLKDKRIRILSSNETPDMASRINMASWCINNLLNSDLVHGELMMYLCDDDLLYPEAFETFWSYYSEHNREPQAMYASQDIGLVDRQGRTKIIGKRIADRPAGCFCKGRKLDGRVDYLQFCHTRAILEKLRQATNTTRYHSEDKRNSGHADGIFMEQIGALTKVHNINKFVSMNRRTISSANLEYSDSRIGRLVIFVKQKFKGLWKRLSTGRQ